MARYVRRASLEGQFERLHRTIEAECRQLFAELLACERDEIAFVPSTSAGLSMVAAGLDWRAGDIVVASEADFPSNIYPWKALTSRGVRLKLIPKRATGEISLDDVRATLDARTRLVALSSAHYVTETTPNIDAVGHVLRPLGVLLCVDAIQSLGVMNCRWEAADFVVADGHKWLLGPQGCGVLMVRRRVFERLTPVLVGWRTADACDYSLSERLRASAVRYEPGSLNAVELVGLHASVSLLIALGLEAISTRVQTLCAYAAHRLRLREQHDHGHPRAASPPSKSGVLSFPAPVRRVSSATLVEQLSFQGIVVSLRKNPEGVEVLRIAPHFYNTERDLDRLVQAIARLGN